MECGLGVAGAVLDVLGLPALSSADLLAAVDIDSEEVERLTDCLHIAVADIRGILAEELEAVFRIGAEKRGIHPPGVVPAVLCAD